MGSWLRKALSSWQQRREAAALARRPIPERLWKRTLRRFPFLLADGRNEQELLRLTRLFLDCKEFSGAHGLQVTDDMAVAIAAQACLPILHLGLPAYEHFVGIVVHPGQARVRREVEDDMGIVHEGEESLAGEAVAGGPVMLSWRDVRAAGATAAQSYNVVIHEFAHVLDMADGVADGCPVLASGWSRNRWTELLSTEHEDFCRRVDAGQETALDPYGTHGPEEFFAVASEAYFVQRAGLKAEHPALDALLDSYYRASPAG